MRFFALARPVPTPTVTPGEEESIQKESKVSSSNNQQDVETASVSDQSSHNDDILVNDGTPLPEFDSEQADDLKRLLLGPLEPNTY